MKRPKLYFDCRVEPGKRRGLRTENRTVDAIITDAYFGKYPQPGPFSIDAPVGLNIDVKCNGATYGQTFTDMGDISGIMNDYGINLPGQLKNKPCTAVFPEDSVRMIGLYTKPK